MLTLPGEEAPPKKSRSKARQDWISKRSAAVERRHAEGSALLGARKAFVAQARELIEHSRAEIQTAFANDHEHRNRYIDAIKRGSEAGDRTAMQIEAAIYKLLGQEDLLRIELVRSFGVSDEAELRGIVEVVKSAEGSDLLTAVMRSRDFIVAALPLLDEHQRREIILSMGGMVPVREVSAE